MKDKFEIESLNIEDLNVEELERRLELALGSLVDMAWVGGCDGTNCNCNNYTCTTYTCTTLCNYDCGPDCGADFCKPVMV